MGRTADLQRIIKYEGSIEAVRLSNDRYRVGFCSQCGACCKTINMDTKGGNVAIEWLTLHGVRVVKRGDIKRDPREDAQEFSLAITLPCPCTKLVLIESTNKYICSIYEERPSICAAYPKNVTGYRTCTYMFLNTEELNKFNQEYKAYWRETHGKEKTIKVIQ